MTIALQRSAPLTKRIFLKFCTIDFMPGESLTTFHDGATTRAWPHHDDHHYSVVAHRCGYADDLSGFCQEHEFVHSLLAERLHNRPSPVLWAIAHNDTSLTNGQCAEEEISVQALQAWLRGNVLPIIGGVDWHGLKADALMLLDGR